MITQKKMVEITMEDGASLFFDLNMVATIFKPSRFGKVEHATLVLITGANINVPVQVAEDLLKHIREMANVVEEKQILTPTRQVQ